MNTPDFERFAEGIAQVTTITLVENSYGKLVEFPNGIPPFIDELISLTRIEIQMWGTKVLVPFGSYTAPGRYTQQIAQDHEECLQIMFEHKPAPRREL